MVISESDDCRFLGGSESAPNASVSCRAQMKKVWLTIDSILTFSMRRAKPKVRIWYMAVVGSYRFASRIHDSVWLIRIVAEYRSGDQSEVDGLDMQERKKPEADGHWTLGPPRSPTERKVASCIGVRRRAVHIFACNRYRLRFALVLLKQLLAMRTAHVRSDGDVCQG
jgi:hypothetical protein